MEITIPKGKTNRDYGCTWYNMFIRGSMYNISSNAVSYLFTGGIFGIQCVVMKNSVEGVKLSSLINTSEGDLTKLDEYITRMLLKRIKPSEMIGLIKKIKTEAYERGRRNKASEIRDVLGF